MALGPFELILTEARSALASQLAALDTYRTRGAAALSVAGLIGALFGTHVLTAHSNLGIGALVAFIVSAALAIWILWPCNVDSGPQLQELHNWSKLHGGTPEATEFVATALIDSLQNAYKTNAEILVRFARLLALVYGLVAVQLVLWAAATLHH
jgi:uncharacterized membrane protein YeaQ/YmgE (transglycosylase-associated protein family)